MKLLLSCLVFVSAVFGQQDPPELAKRIVPVSVQMSSGLELRATGVRVAPATIIIPEAILTLKVMTGVNIVVNGKPFSQFVGLGNGMIMLSVPDGGDSDVPMLKAAKLKPGERVAWYAGYRNGELVSRYGKVTVNEKGSPVADSVNIGIGWGVFSPEGELIAIVRDHFLAPMTQPGAEIKFSVMTQPGASILAAMPKLVPLPAIYK